MAHKPGRPHNFRALSKPKQLTKREHRHYWPYIPVLLLVIATFLVSMVQPTKRGVLAYATNMSAQGLLDATNDQRSKAQASSLALSSSLNAAAQAKAEDMVARNYWSHDTPDGQEPWVFITNAGYSYQKAGENLAFGFTDSQDAVTGWMNSPTHRDNLLDTNFTEVGFGIANSNNFDGNGEETVVVAMYAQPRSATAPAPVATTKVNPLSSHAQNNNEPATLAVSRVHAMTNGQAPWAFLVVGILTGLSLALLLAKHAAGVRHVLRDGEKFVLRHPVLDTVLVSLILVGTFLSQTTGFIK